MTRSLLGMFFVCFLLFSFFIHCSRPRPKPSHKRKRANEPPMPLAGPAVPGPQTTYVLFFRFYFLINFVNSAFSLASTFLLALLLGRVVSTFRRMMRYWRNRFLVVFVCFYAIVDVYVAFLNFLFCMYFRSYRTLSGFLSVVEGACPCVKYMV